MACVPESLQTAARTIINKNINREYIYLLPLPTSIQDDCFINSASDRSIDASNVSGSDENSDENSDIDKRNEISEINWALDRRDAIERWNSPEINFRTVSRHRIWLMSSGVYKNLTKLSKNYLNITIENDSSIEYCKKGCKFFSFTEVFKFPDFIPDWSESAISDYSLNLLYEPQLHPSIATDAEWLNVPSRRQLIERYRELKQDSHSGDSNFQDSNSQDALKYCRDSRSRDSRSRDSRSRDSHSRNSYSREIEDLEIMLNTLRFHPSTGLGEIHKWIHRFVYHKYDCFWYRVRVLAGCMKSFVDSLVEAKLSVVMLPYGSVSLYSAMQIKEEDERLAYTVRDMFFVVKDTENDRFIAALNRTTYSEKTIPTFPFTNTNKWFHYLDIETFLRHIVNVCNQLQVRPCYNDGPEHNVIFNPVVPHANWWLFLMVPMNFFKENWDWYYRQPEVKNCVILFDKQNLCIGEPIRNFEKYICENEQPFVYWIKKEKLSVNEIQNFPTLKESENFVDWCISKRMNTILNLNCMNSEEDYREEFYYTCSNCNFYHYNEYGMCGKFPNND